jgi:hypothetical protein
VITRRIRSFIALDRAERSLAIRAIGWILWAGAVLRLRRFSWVRDRIDGTRPDGRGASAADVRRAIHRAARTLPGSGCLAQSIAAEILLRAAEQPVRLTVGVARSTVGQEPTLDAHAWVESGGVIVAGDGNLGRYGELLTYGSAG